MLNIGLIHMILIRNSIKKKKMNKKKERKKKRKNYVRLSRCIIPLF